MQTVSILRQLGSKITTEIYALPIKVVVIGAIAVAKAAANVVAAIAVAIKKNNQ